MSKRARNGVLAEWRAAAQRAADAGDYAAAKAALIQAIERDQKNASLRHNLGIVEEYLGSASAAASSYSTALRYLGLYSQRARQHISDIEHDHAYPGRGCIDAVARAFRADLLSRPESSLGARIALSPSFWNLNEFRDLVLHEQEHRLTLPAIDQALRSHNLKFRGFTLDRKTVAHFGQMFPGGDGPGTLAQWDTFEDAHPGTFAGMFCFWCDRD